MHHLLKHINQDITYLKMRELGPDALSVVGPTCIYKLELLFYLSIQMNILLSYYLCFISFFNLDLYLLRGDTSIS